MSARGARWRPKIKTATGSTISGSQPTAWPAAGGCASLRERISSATSGRLIGFLWFQNILKYRCWQAGPGNDLLAGEDQACDLAHASPELEEAPEIGDGERPELSVSAIHGLHELEQIAQTLLRFGVDGPRFFERRNAVTEHV